LRKKFPEWSESEVLREVGNYWAKGAPSTAAIDPLAPPPHATGGVVDLTLRNVRNGEHLFMGSAFDEVSPISHVDHFEREGQKRTLTMSEELARQNRRILYAVMTEAGFAVNPNEWWHFGYGDKLSASLTEAPFAVYSIMQI
jgi:D-alanyl-D-alanine dipeptidase